MLTAALVLLTPGLIVGVIFGAALIRARSSSVAKARAALKAHTSAVAGDPNAVRHA